MIFENEYIFIEIQPSEIAWFKIFTKRKIKEFSLCSSDEKSEILRVLDLIERELISFYNPTKINIAQFGNYLPHLHWHIMARFENDSYYPESMWGVKQRDGEYVLKDLDLFCENLISKLL